MSDEVAAFMSRVEAQEGFAHAEETIGDVWDDMDDYQKDLVAILIGSDEDPNFSDEQTEALSDIYDTLAPIEKDVLAFMVSEGRATEFDDDSMAQSGVKGMRWGVRKDGKPGSTKAPSFHSKYNADNAEGRAARGAARAKVKAGTASLEDAHIAAVKSRGHRTANALLGDKNYWKKTAVIAGLTIAGGAAAPLVGAAAGIAIPASMLPSFIPTAAVVGMGASATIAKAATLTTMVGVSVASSVASTSVGISNLKRAITGNGQVSRNHAQLAGHLTKNLTASDARTKKILTKRGSISKKYLNGPKIKHSEPSSIDLVHSFIASVEAAEAVRDAEEIQLLVHFDDIETFLLQHEDRDLLQVDELEYFLSHYSEHQLVPVDDLDAYLEHVGVKGMKWGVRRSAEALGRAAKSRLGSKGGKGGKGDDADDDVIVIETRHMSVDAERFVRTRQKDGFEMSDRELKEAIGRAKLVKEYDELFNPSPGKVAQDQWAAYEANARISAQQAAMNPSRMKKVSSFIKTVSPAAVNAYNTLDKASGGAMSKQVEAAVQKKMGLAVNAGAKGKAPQAQSTPAQAQPQSPAKTQSTPTSATQPQTPFQQGYRPVSYSPPPTRTAAPKPPKYVPKHSTKTRVVVPPKPKAAPGNSSRDANFFKGRHRR